MLCSLSKLSSSSSCEILNFERIRKSYITPKLINDFLHKQEHSFFNIEENATNMFLTMQGYMIDIFTNMYFLKDLRYCDKIDPLNIEVNNPYTRQLIRNTNTASQCGHFYIHEFELDRFCMNLLERFFPNVNNAWCNWNHFTHVKVLHLVRYVLAYGFFKEKDVDHLSILMVKACQSLSKLEEAWNMKYLSEKEAIIDQYLKFKYTANSKQNLNMTSSKLQKIKFDLMQQIFKKEEIAVKSKSSNSLIANENEKFVMQKISSFESQKKKNPLISILSKSPSITFNL